MGRKKIWKDPIRINFQLEKQNYDNLLIEMGKDGYNVLQIYLSEIIKETIGEDKWV